MKFVIESVSNDPNRFGEPIAIVVSEDVPEGPAHSQIRLVISGDLDALSSMIQRRIDIGDKLEIRLDETEVEQSEAGN